MGWNIMESIDELILLKESSVNLIKYQGINCYVDEVKTYDDDIWNKSIHILMILNEASGNQSIYALMILNETSGNPVIYWWYWMKHQWIHWCTEDIEGNIRECINLLMLLKETSVNPIIYQGINCCIDEVKNIMMIWGINLLIYWWYWIEHQGINLLINCWCWMKYQGILFYTDDIAWNISESIDVLKVLKETSANLIKHQGIHCYIDEILSYTDDIDLKTWNPLMK